ncbi:hypothetical protein M899_2864 [Bacteriovorax sp. BSW11_IV]|uniref:hypothetical protein n=1 Tax=Bacteriovorax sp. BSW11_IV TaxID=1353529 RepID=UPI00038A26D4|nr:hypothetical protein [Bacteriovorax sp. BSW11_IV]EQC50183.1 hypothetical protein M899_2864 [Bacteriovorax sp. BSW11_IV]
MDFIDQFEKHYNYDCNYMRKMAKANPKAFETFVNFLPMGQVGKSLPSDVLWTAKIAAMLTEDCGACVQLNITMALEAGVDKNIVQNIVKSPNALNDDLKLVYDFAKAVATNQEDHHSIQKIVEQKFSADQLTELALAIASTKIYPSIKRALGDFKSCSLYQFSI